ncbi:MAG TPA: helix-turn-helix domain-containing protein [Ilumatobacteraceae bacterium]
MDSLDVLGVPASPLLTVEEAARVLRIGRSLAYQLAAEYIASGGLSGLPVIRIGGCLRVPRWALLELVFAGRVARVCDVDVDALLASSGVGDGH